MNILYYLSFSGFLFDFQPDCIPALYNRDAQKCHYKNDRSDAGADLGSGLEGSSLVVLGDLNISAAVVWEDSTAQDRLATLATMGLSIVISGPMHQAGHTMDTVFCADQGDNDRT